MLCLCPRRVSDSCILGGRAVRGIIFPSLPWQGQWDNICKVAPKSFFSPKRWIQATAGSGWLRAWHLQADEKYFIKLKLQVVTWEMVWYNPRPPQPCSGNASSHFWGAPLPRHHPHNWERAGIWNLQESIKFSEKTPVPPCYQQVFCFSVGHGSPCPAHST